MIPTLGFLPRLSRDSFGIVGFSARPSELELRPDFPNSPVIGAGEEIVSRK